MKGTLVLERMTGEQNQRIAETVEREQARLRNFIRRRVPDRSDAEDILQEVFYEFVEAYRLMKPIERAGAWLFQVARNRIIDLFRKKKLGSINEPVALSDDGEALLLEDLLPSPEAGPEAAFARNVLIEELEDALEELPVEQRQVFIAHEIEGRSFKEIAAETGLGINTLLSRKRYAVLFLRRRLEAIHGEFTKE
ncbi:MAG TPA: sigma-70 family RNA polymerase sigma factor [Candidatus Angelobacter sp.]|jgi:RNA polymerase sigma factor (sigma-70 family)|nr:sigma-70 family RNA polymerase sigma factor [Candidatus Angelobacter sp.]